MSKKLYVGNLSFSATENEVRDLFAQHGTVESCELVMDRDSGRPRGFGFVVMDESGAESAVRALNGSSLGGRDLTVNEARQREDRSSNRW